MTDKISDPATGTTTIGVRIPAELEQLMMLRALAETVALIADFAIDEVTDIRLALDEVATALILDATPDTTIDCEFTYDSRRMFVHVAGVAASDGMVGKQSFGWHIVQTLTDTLSTVQAPYDGILGGYPTVVEFSWTRGTSDGG